MKTLTGILSSILVVGNLIAASLPLFVMALIRVLLELSGSHRAASWLTEKMDLIIDYWVGSNRLIFRTLGIYRDECQWQGEERLKRDGWYLAVSNHQSWPDILILQTVLKHTPAIKFFTKRQLLFIPFFGQAMWCLGFPYVHRLSREQITANPELLTLDRQATIDASEGFKNHPTTVLNFLEGTRYTRAKHDAQDGRFTTLLNPKSGGMSLVIGALEDRLECLIDVTINYPNGTPTFWDFMKGDGHEVEVSAHCLDFPESVRNAENIDDRRVAVEAWVEEIWQEKDRRLLNRQRAESM